MGSNRSGGYILAGIPDGNGNNEVGTTLVGKAVELASSGFVKAIARVVGIEVSAKLVTVKMKEMLGSTSIVVDFAIGELAITVGTKAIEG